MSGRMLGVKLGSPGEVMRSPMDEQIKAARGEGFKGHKTYDDHPSAYLALSQGTVDGVLNTLPTLAKVKLDRPGHYEIVRGGVGAVEKGQTEAAKSVGMTRGKILVYILLPQAARQMVPPFTNEMITMIKSSSLLSVISVYELTRSGQAIISVHFVPFEIYGLLALYYWVMITTLSWLTRRLEARLPVW